MLFGNKITSELWAEIIASQQQAPVRKTLGSELQPPRNESLIDQLRHYKPTAEQRAQALRYMANISRDRMIQGIADYEAKKYERENPAEELPRQIEMPPLELNRSKSKIVNLFWDTLEGILPK